jgi:hypothetical protein
LLGGIVVTRLDKGNRIRPGFTPRANTRPSTGRLNTDNKLRGLAGLLFGRSLFLFVRFVRDSQ